MPDQTDNDAGQQAADDALDLNPDGGLATLVDMRLPIPGRDSSVTNLPPVVQDPNQVRLQRMLAREHQVYGVPTPLVGRREQLEKLYDAVASSVNTKTLRTVIIRGEPGTGKTRLLAEMFGIIDPVRRGIVVLPASASETEAPDGMGVVAQLLRQRFEILASDSDDEAYDKLLAGMEEIVDERMVTTAARLLAYLAGLKAAVAMTGEERLDNLRRFHRRAVATLFNLLRYDAMQQPLVVVVHRAHHVTPRVVEVLTQAYEALAGTAITFILLTTGKLPGVLAPRGPAHADLLMTPLPTPEMERLAMALLVHVNYVPDRLVADLVERSVGNPGLLEDNFRLLIERRIIEPRSNGSWTVKADKAPPEPMPATVEAVSAARVRALSDELKRVLQMASVVGPTFWTGAVVALSRATPPPKDSARRDVPWVTDKVSESVEEILEEALTAEHVVVSKASSVDGSREFSFTNREACQALYDELEPARLAKLHRMAAQWFQTIESEEGGRWSEVVAGHLEAGGRPERAARHLRDAGRAAAEAYDLTKARELYRRGVGLIDIDEAPLLVELLEGMGQVEYQRGELAASRRTFGTLLEATMLAQDKGAGARTWLSLGRVHRARGDYSRARPCFQNALRLSRQLDNTQGIADSLDEIAKLVWLQGGKGSYDEALDFFQRALEIRRILGDPKAIALSLSNVANIWLLRGEFQPALDGFSEAMALRRRVGDRSGEAMTHVGLGATYFAGDDTDKATEHWEAGLGLAEQVGHRALAGVLLNNLGEARLKQGRLDEAETLLTEATEVAVDIGDQRAQADILRNLAGVDCERGDFRAGLKRAKAAVEQAREIEAHTTMAVALTTLGDLLSRSQIGRSKGSRNKADKVFESAQRLLAGAGDVVGSLRTLRFLAAHAQRWEDVAGAERVQAQIAALMATCQPLVSQPPPQPPPLAGKGRARKVTQPKQGAVPLPALPPTPELPPTPPPVVPWLSGDAGGEDSVPAAPQHTLEFDASELRRGLIEVPAGLAGLADLTLPTKKPPKAKSKSKSKSKSRTKSSGTKKKSAKIKKVTKKGQPQPAGPAPPPLPKGD